ncbi:MAG: O-antigen ligase family protein [Candidatus Berkelbacteria bacterium]|nr:O-antigen ligase family protein [Candidatus Berkelbacteria bacterium]MCR4308050.1 O-antigen ligase family protein [Candidatus Berkelbacteria bacterium]
MSLVVERLRLWCLAALIFFLPLSAWLVSVTGQELVGLGRNLLLGLLIILSIVRYRQFHRPNPSTWLALFFILLVLVSYWYRQDSVLQWLRGVRYLIEPLLLYVTLQLWPLTGSKQKLWQALAFVTALVVLGAVVEFVAPELLRTTIDSTGRGYLGQIHLASSLTRLQSTLAGPNALGLFLLVSLLLWPLWQKVIPKYLAITTGVFGLAAILLTFSRSSYTGFLFGGATLVTTGRQVLGKSARLLTVSFVALLVLIGALLIARPEELVRTASNTTRFEQYERVWEQRGEIGFWGRGAGAAGLVSVDRLDGGANYYTENSYLDAYEAVGLLAALAYLGFWICLVWSLLRAQTATTIAVGATALGLAVAGIFINHYTGQAAIWLTLLFAGVASGKASRVEERPVNPIATRVV